MAINKEFRVKHGLISEDDVQVNGSVTATSFIGDGSQLTGISSFSGDYNDLTNKPVLFSGSYNDLSNQPTIPTDVSQLTDNTNVLFSGDYNDLTNKPILFSGSYNDLTNLPNLVKAAVEWSPNHTLADGTRYLAGDVVWDNGNIYVANYDNESLPTSNTLYWTNLGPGNRLNIDGRDIPNISYTQLSNIPTDLATESYVNTQVANLVDSSPTTLDTLNELAAALGDDPNFATTVSTQIGLKANTADLSNVAFDGLLNNLDDVVISSPTATHYLKFDGTNWVNSPVSSIADISGGGIASPTFVQFDTTYNGVTPTGQVSWNSSDGTLDVGLLGGNVVLQVGQEQVQRIFNNTGSTLLEGQAVYITGAQGQRLTVNLAQSNAESTSSKTFGVVTENIGVETEGYITTEGLVRNINTSAYAEGAALWLSPTTPGGITTTKPIAPQHLVLIGFCVRQHATAGSIFVKVQNGYELDELHDVLINGKANGDVLKYDAATGVWKNAQLSAVAYSNSYNDLSDKPTIPSDVSQLTDNTGVLFSGSYNDLTDKPNQSLNTTSNVSFNNIGVGQYSTLSSTGPNYPSDIPAKLVHDVTGQFETKRFVFNGYGGIELGTTTSTSAGQYGQVLTSRGPYLSAEWQNVSVPSNIQQALVTSAIAQSNSYANWVDLSGFSVNITPTSTTSKILIQLHFGALTQSTNAIVFRLVRNGTPIALGDASSSRPQATTRSMREGDTNHTRAHPTINYLDSPNTTSTVTYKIQWMCEGSATIYINRAQNDTDGQSYGSRTISTLIAQEFKV